MDGALYEALGVEAPAVDWSSGKPVAKGPGRQNDALVTVPTSLKLDEKHLRGNVVGSFIEGWPMQAGGPAAVALAMLHETFLGDSSPWAMYLKSLPGPGDPALDVPLVWPEEDQEELARSSTTDLKGLRAAIAEDHAWLQANAFAAAPDLFPPELYSLERYTWAHAVALSRGVVVDGALAVVPGISEARRVSAGSGRANVEVQARATGGLFSARKESLCLAATAAVVAGDDLALGVDESPAELLLNYGVPPVDAPCECVLRFGVSPNDPLAGDKTVVLEDMAGLSANQMWTIRSGNVDRSDLLRYMRVVQLQGIDAFILEAVFINDVWDYHLAEPFSRENEDRAVDEVIRACAENLQKFAGNEQEDAMLGADPASSRKAALAALRMRERAALRDTMHWFQAEKEGNSGKEYYQERRLRELNLDRPVDPEEIVPG